MAAFKRLFYPSLQGPPAYFGPSDPTPPPPTPPTLPAWAQKTFYVAPSDGVWPSSTLGSCFGGRLTLESGEPIMTGSDQVNKDRFYYAPYMGDRVPVFDGAQWQLLQFTTDALDQIGSSLVLSGAWSANTSYHVFATAGGFVTGPGWTTTLSGLVQLIRLNGVRVNAAEMATRGTAGTSTCLAYRGSYLGSITIGPTAGVLTAHFGYGQLRRWDIWNAYHQEDIWLSVGEMLGAETYTPTNQYPDWVPFNDDPDNSATVFSGLPTVVEALYHQSGFIYTLDGAAALVAAVGWNGDGVGYWGKYSFDNSGPDHFVAAGMAGTAHYVNKSAVGVNTATMFVAGANTWNCELWGGSNNPAYSEDLNSVMLVRWKG